MRLQTSLGLDIALSIVSLALAAGRAEKMLPLTVVVIDVSGKIIASQSEDGSGLMRFDIARGKAWGALGMGMSSRLIRDRLATRPSFQAALATVADGQFVPVPGGVLVFFEGLGEVGDLLGRSWSPWRHFGNVLGPFGRILGSFCDILKSS